MDSCLDEWLKSTYHKCPWKDEQCRAGEQASQYSKIFSFLKCTLDVSALVLYVLIVLMRHCDDSFTIHQPNEVCILAVTASAMEAYVSTQGRWNWRKHHLQGLAKNLFFCYFWSKMGSIQSEIKYLKSILIFQLQRDMNQIFWMRYCRSFNDNL